MHKSDSPFIADWFAVSLRWVIIIGLLVSLGLDGGILAWPNVLLILLIGWNLVMTVFAGVNHRLNRHREINLAIDTTFSILFFVLWGGFAGPVYWVVMLPILIGTLYFEWRGAFGAASIMAAVEIVFSLLQGFSIPKLIFTLVAATATFGLAVIFGYVAKQMILSLRRSRTDLIVAREREDGDREKVYHMENERVRAIYDLTSALTATLNYERVLEIALDLSLTALNFEPDAGPDDRLISAVLLFTGDVLVVGSARRFTQADMRVELPARKGALVRVIDGGDPVILKSASGDPELAHIVALRGCNSVYVLPLRSGFNIYGIMVLGHPLPDYFTPDRRDMVDILGRQLVIAIQNARLYQDLADEKNRMVEVQEEMRKKLARDLHDGPTQSVAAIAMRVNLARRMMERDVKAATDELVKIEELARRTAKEIRHMLFTLRPLILESQGLVAALQLMAEKTKETYGQEVLVNVDESLLPDLEMGKQGVIFFIAEEAVNNARKHAQAPHIWVRLRTVEKGIVLFEIVDDGLGFDVDAITRAYDKRGSLGMVNLRERTELVNGLIHIDSAPGKGTKVQVFIPLNEEAADRLHHAKK
jgi:signal transduction histidine kinase